jgi:hypothetical protein
MPMNTELPLTPARPCAERRLRHGGVGTAGQDQATGNAEARMQQLSPSNPASACRIVHL